VCFGKLCTVVSPREGKEKLPPFNWRRTLEHEFGHVMVLQATKFKTPRWYTEAFSTYIEQDSRVESDMMMVQAISKNELKPIDKMNEYFRSNILMAYVHGRYVIEYIDKSFGFDAHIKAMKLFAEGKTVAEALPAATGKTIDELSKGQIDFTKEAFSHVHIRPRYSVADLARLELAANAPEAKAEDLANLAMFYYASRQGAKATEFAKKALEKNPKCSDALNLLARQAYEKKDFEAAKKLFEDAIAAAPEKSFTAWQKLGVIYKKEGKTSKAIDALEKARAIYPRYQGEDNPHYLLPDLYTDLEKPDNDKALQVWRDAVKANANDAQAAKNGMKLALDVKDWKAATEFVTAFIEIDPYDLEIHQKGGRAYEELKDYPRAAREYKIAGIIDSLDIESWVGAARVHLASGNKDEAKKAVEKALEIDGKHEEAKALRKKLQE
jgi:tetratricopeptide (TPR) repeat protein